MPTKNDIVSFQKNVLFCVRKTNGYNFDGLITYDVVDVNIGSAMSINSGIFVAPEAGTYEFSFSGVTMSGRCQAKILVYKDGIVQHIIYDGNFNTPYNNIKSSWMMKLAKGQKIYLKITQGMLHAISADHFTIHTLFTGNLLKRDA